MVKFIIGQGLVSSSSSHPKVCRHLNERGASELLRSVADHWVSHFMTKNHLCQSISFLIKKNYKNYLVFTASWSSFLQKSSIPLKTKMFPLGRTKAFFVGCKRQKWNKPLRKKIFPPDRQRSPSTVCRRSVEDPCCPSGVCLTLRQPWTKVCWCHKWFTIYNL